jgi:hypothetical protein
LQGKSYDNTIYLPQQYGGTVWDLWQTSNWQHVQNHLMPTVHSALKQKGYN